LAFTGIEPLTMLLNQDFILSNLTASLPGSQSTKPHLGQSVIVPKRLFQSRSI